MNRKLVKILVFLLPILIFGTGFALTQVSFSNTSVIVAGRSIFITQPTFTSQTCPVDGNPAYINTGFAPLVWTLTQGGAALQAFFCIDNQGSAPDTPHVTATGTGITDGSCPSTSNSLTWAAPSGLPTTLTGHSAPVQVTISVCAGSNQPVTGTGPTFTVTVT